MTARVPRAVAPASGWEGQPGPDAQFAGNPTAGGNFAFDQWATKEVRDEESPLFRSARSRSVGFRQLARSGWVTGGSTQAIRRNHSTQVEALGVPEGQRSHARAILLDLSRRLDTPNLSWDALREAMTFVMEFPALGRRMIPLLLPYFDRAA